jgi:hypothetical protein
MKTVAMRISRTLRLDQRMIAANIGQSFAISVIGA